jgi:hypothetical protein
MEFAAPMFDMLAGITPVESGNRRAFDDRLGRALVAPWKLPSGTHPRHSGLWLVVHIRFLIGSAAARRHPVDRLRALAAPMDTPFRRFHPDDRLLAFLESL